MTCDACEKAATNPHCGAYRMQCLECCTRLVLSGYAQLVADRLHGIER